MEPSPLRADFGLFEGGAALICRSVAAVFLPLLFAMHPIQAQQPGPGGHPPLVVSGMVLDIHSGNPVNTASVVLVGEDGEPAAVSISNREGRFRLTAPAPGRYRLSLTRLSFQPGETGMFELRADEAFPPVTLEMTPEPLILDGVEVTVDALPAWRLNRPPSVWRFYEEMERQQRIGNGRHMGKDDLDRWDGTPSGSLLLAMGASTRGGGTCSGVTLFVEGRYYPTTDLPVERVLDSDFPLHTLEGVSIYRSINQLPAHYIHPNYYPPSCAYIDLWRRRGG